MVEEPNSNERRRVHVRVKGRVHGVGFRAHAEFFARQIGVSGWVRNVGSDEVEAVAEGSAEQVARFLEIFQQGPRMARVDEARVEEEPPTGEGEGFEVRRSA